MSSKKTAPPVRRYSVEVKDVDSGQSFLIAVDWTDDERRVALAQIMRLAGVSVGAGDCFLDEVRSGRARREEELKPRF